MTAAQKKFIETIWSHYKKHRRAFPWRDLDWKKEKNSPAATYAIVVSEIMLQQTQAPRVVPRYERFMKRFPNWRALAKASTAEVLTEWQGLGYNRRGLYLKKIAEEIIAAKNKLPRTYDELRTLPGIGPNTAGSILAFAFNIPHPFIETNIRSVFIHFFFNEKTATKITDKEILMLVTATLNDKRNNKNPREWYYALMDYGAMLKQKLRDDRVADPARKSAIYKKQSTFKGSNRELRAAILRHILNSSQPLSPDDIIAEFVTKNHLHRHPKNILKNISDLEHEGFIEIKKVAGTSSVRIK